MRLRARQVESLIAAEAPMPQTIRSADEHYNEAGQLTDSFIQSLIQNKSSSTARLGEQLPQPPRRGRSNEGYRPQPLSFESDAEASSSSGDESSIALAPLGRSDSLGLVETIDTNENGGRLIPCMLPAALAGTDIASITSKAGLIKALTTNLPINEFGLPRIIYRSDILDLHTFQDQGHLDGTYLLAAQYKEMQDYLDAATIYLEYSEGFPALPSGEALWQRLPQESPEAYAAFTDYCVLIGTRQVTNISSSHPLETLLGWFHEHYWGLRAKCYDLHHAVHQAKLREQRILGSEDKHYKLADKLVQKLEHMLETVNWDTLAQEPEKYLKAMSTAITLQRQALGLSSATSTTGRKGEGAEVRNESIELIMRRATAPELKMLRDTRAEGGHNEVSVRSLLKDSDALANAQELIVRMSNTTLVNAPPLPDDLDDDGGRGS